MLSQLVAVMFCALVARPAMAGSCSRTYTVQDGDICDSISAANNASTYQLAVNNINNINYNCSNLQYGEIICLGSVGADCQTTHVVGSGDTCDSIASAAGINTTMLNLNNPQIDADCTNVYIGEVLCTAGSLLATPIPSSSKPLPTPSPSPVNNDNLPYCDEL